MRLNHQGNGSNDSNDSNHNNGHGHNHDITEEQLSSQQTQSELRKTIDVLEQTVLTQTNKIHQLTEQIQQLEQQQTLLSTTNAQLLEDMKSQGEDNSTYITNDITNRITTNDDYWFGKDD